jgi:peptidoglycan hydrolase-like protein with peptidoglycan-binding domain
MRKRNSITAALIGIAAVGTIAFAAPANAAESTVNTPSSAASSNVLDISKMPNVKSSEVAAVPASTAALAHCNKSREFTYKADTREVLTGPAYGTSSTCILEKGNSSSAVWALQNTLNSCYSAGLAWDGEFGPDTYNALLKVQRSIGVTIDGVYGPNTRDKMRWWGSQGGCASHTAYNGF